MRIVLRSHIYILADNHVLGGSFVMTVVFHCVNVHVTTP